MTSDILPPHFRRDPINARRTLVGRQVGIDDPFSFLDSEYELIDKETEACAGYVPIPVGIAQGFVIDSQPVSIPMATEEASVVAAASFAASLAAQRGGFATTPPQSIVPATVYVENASEYLDKIRINEAALKSIAQKAVENLEKYGGGFRSLSIFHLVAMDIVKITCLVDCAEVMGANPANGCAEAIATECESITGVRPVLSILSNNCPQRIASAQFTVDFSMLERFSRVKMAGELIAKRICLANRIAASDPDRTATHIKGIMNGVTALTLATGNDTRAVEAAVYAFAYGGAAPLTRYEMTESRLTGSIQLPVPIGARGGSVGYLQATKSALQLLGNPNAARMGSIAASLGLAQNFAALFALTTTGIRFGHLKLHARKSNVG